jgi:hypothetical protein
MSSRAILSEIRLPTHDETIGSVTILDAEGRVVRVVAASEFRYGPVVRRHPAARRRAAHQDRPLRLSEAVAIPGEPRR